MKSFMFSRLWHLLLQLASTVPWNIIKDKDKDKDKSAHLAHLLGPIFGLVAALGSWCVPVALYFAPACLLGGQRTFSLFHIVIAMNLRVWELPGFLPKTFPELWVLEGCTELHFWILKHFWSQGCATGCPSIFCADLLLEIKLVIFSQYEHHILTDPRNAQGPCQGFILTQGLSHPSPICMCYASASHAAYTWIANFSGMCVCSDGKFVCKRKPLFHLEQNSREGHCRTKQACYIETNISNK